jgi:hypothetical protein
MDTPIQNNIESRSATGTESLRITKVAKLHQEIEALDAQKNAKEQELIKLQLEPSSLFEGFDRADRSSPALRPEEKIAGLDLASDLCIPLVPAAQFALIKPHFDPKAAQSLRYAPGGASVLSLGRLRDLQKPAWFPTLARGAIMDDGVAISCEFIVARQRHAART